MSACFCLGVCMAQLISKGRQLSLSQPQVMGILNVTPDSFSDGGRVYKTLDKALFLAEQMMHEGAAIIDVGGESTRPGAAPVSEQEEIERVVPVVEAIAARLDVWVSVDSSTPAVMTSSARAGAAMLNDVRAFQRPGALEAAAAASIPLCVMHMQGEPQTMQSAPEYQDVVKQVKSFLLERACRCQEYGIAAEQIVLDPGFGFGKSLSHNLRLMQSLVELTELDYPLLIGVSRKSMIGQVTGKTVDQRLAGGLALAVMAYERGARIFRVHDVAATVDALRMAAAVMEER